MISFSVVVGHIHPHTPLSVAVVHTAPGIPPAAPGTVRRGVGVHRGEPSGGRGEAVTRQFSSSVVVGTPGDSLEDQIAVAVSAVFVHTLAGHPEGHTHLFCVLRV